MSNAGDRSPDQATLDQKLNDLYALIDGIELAMFTTRRPDGQLVSRPMATQTQAEGSDLWFVTDIASNKVDQLQFDPHVNLTYYKDRTREWVSVSGTATISQDRRDIHRLYQKDWRAWFGDEGASGTAGRMIRASPWWWWTSSRWSISRSTSLNPWSCSKSPG
ncbi:MAG TPA: pyridoxamine 5'-phosphate oxidase family protein, partial [Gemmatimonadales bacterium]|nr:pyridoxamine 5'-phosphate oxidase family protein [Gemmatimonadales bacterium]